VMHNTVIAKHRFIVMRINNVRIFSSNNVLDKKTSFIEQKIRAVAFNTPLSKYLTVTLN